MNRKIKNIREKTDKMKEVALQRRAHKTLGLDVSDFVRKRVEALKTGHGKEVDVRDDVAALIAVSKGMPKNVNDFLDYVQTTLKKEDHDIAMLKVKKRDEVKNQIPKFER